MGQPAKIVIGFDADDTVRHCANHFAGAQARIITAKSLNAILALIGQLKTRV